MADPITPGASVGLEQTYEKVREALPTIDQADGALLEVAPQVRVIALRSPTLPPAAHTNCYVIGPTNHAGSIVLVDPGSPYPGSQQTLDAVIAAERDAGRPLAAVVLTHAHHDHSAGALHLRNRWNIEILAHADCANALRRRAPIDRVVDEGPTRIADHELTLVHTPGHAPGHLCIVVDDHVVIAGDMVAGMGTILIDPSEGDMDQYLASLERLEALGETTLLPAHGPPIPQGRDKLRQYRAHRLQREQKIADALAQLRSATAEEIVPLAYADTPAPFWPLAVRSTLAHLQRLTRTGRARSVAERWEACP